MIFILEEVNLKLNHLSEACPHTLCWINSLAFKPPIYLQHSCLHLHTSTCQKQSILQVLPFHKSFPNILNILSVFPPLKPHLTLIALIILFCASHLTSTARLWMSWRQGLYFVIFVSYVASSAASLCADREFNIHVFIHLIIKCLEPGIYPGWESRFHFLFIPMLYH